MHFGPTAYTVSRSGIRHRLLLVAAAALLTAGVVQAQTAARRPLAPDHALIGKWKLEIPNSACDGVLEVRANGTTRATSAEQVVESDIELAPAPSVDGFYKMAETITTENGKVNCVGNKIQVGQSGTNFLILNSAADEMLMCGKEDINTCVGPFARQKPN
jgi:hypothetical protein